MGRNARREIRQNSSAHTARPICASAAINGVDLPPPMNREAPCTLASAITAAASTRQPNSSPGKEFTNPRSSISARATGLRNNHGGKDKGVPLRRVSIIRT
uniref:Uncharacterized protein n=1 Tax=uncultured microorganism TaxID=358574 RepID=I2FJJ5_9ZZZZ|nr:hypothetical protein [uncultured microorganism]